jgi:hypothetical protein
LLAFDEDRAIADQGPVDGGDEVGQEEFFHKV